MASGWVGLMGVPGLNKRPTRVSALGSSLNQGNACFVRDSAPTGFAPGELKGEISAGLCSDIDTADAGCWMPFVSCVLEGFGGPQHKLARFHRLASRRLGTAHISQLSLGGGGSQKMRCPPAEVGELGAD